MLKQVLALYFIMLTIPYTSRSQLQPIGQWRDHLPYQLVMNLASTTDKIWAATPYSIFSVDISDQSIERYSKINGLSETGISAISAAVTGEKVVIGYNNSNIDVLSGSNVININALKNSSVTGDKTIYSIFIRDQQALVGTGLGIIVLDLDKYEIKDSWIIGTNGSKIKISAVAGDGNFFYTATTEGLKKAAVNNTNLADFRNWELVSGTNGLPAGAVQGVISAANNMITLKNDSLFLQSGTSWSFLYTDGWTIKNSHSSGNKILLSEEKNGIGRIAVVTPAGIAEKIIQDARLTAAPKQALIFQNEYWIADSLAGLSKYTGSTFERYLPDAPPAISTGSMQVLNNTLWATAGSVNANWEPVHNKNGLFKFHNNSWAYLNASNTASFDTLPDFITVAIDPSNENLWAGSFGGGLVNIQPNNSVTTYKQNSAVRPAYFAANSYRVSGLAFDGDNNLWIANYGSEQPVIVKKANDSWRSFVIPYPIAEQAVAQIVVDDVNQKWIVLPKGNGLVCFNHGQTIDNPGDDQWKWYRAGKGNGNLPDNNVLCIAKDKNSFIWVGTSRGIGVVQCVQEVFTSQGCEAVLPVVQQDNFAGYLFRNEQVQTIAVDGADRKWVGTKNGVWLISADAEKTIYRFTESNSPLLSNDVKQIAVDGKTGEVFFATANGICSFRSTATETTAANNEVLVFPNPVPPSYTGTIAIRGIPNNAIVKIAELNGRLVYQTRALGGQAIWNGKDYKGRAIATGVYLVLVSDDSRREKMVTKIVFIQK